MDDRAVGIPVRKSDSDPTDRSLRDGPDLTQVVIRENKRNARALGVTHILLSAHGEAVVGRGFSILRLEHKEVKPRALKPSLAGAGCLILAFHDDSIESPESAGGGTTAAGTASGGAEH